MKTNKNQRFGMRASRTKKARWQRAAALEGMTLSEFVDRAANDRADRVLDAHTVITLSIRDQARFVDAILNPPAPNAALRRAAKALGVRPTA